MTSNQIPHLHIVVAISVSIRPIRRVAADVRDGLVGHAVLLRERLAHPPPVRDGTDSADLFNSELAVRPSQLSPVKYFVRLVVAMSRPAQVVGMAVASVSVDMCDLVFRRWLWTMIGRANYSMHETLNDLPIMSECYRRIIVFEPRLYNLSSASPITRGYPNNRAVPVYRILGRFFDNLRLRCNHSKSLPYVGKLFKALS